MVAAYATDAPDARRAGFHVITDGNTPSYDSESHDEQASRRCGAYTMIPERVRDMKDGFAVAVFEAIARHANGKQEAWPSIAKVCELTGWSKKIVGPAIERLVQAGAIRKERRQLHGMDQSNRYVITAYEQVVPTEPAVVPTEPPVVPTVPLGGSHGSSGWFPQNHELEPIELKPKELEDVKTAPKKPRQSAPETPVPDNLRELIPEGVWAKLRAETGLNDDQLRYETELMIDRNLRKGGTSRDWVASWRSWMRSPYRTSKPITATQTTIAMPPEIQRLPWNNAQRLKWEYEHRGQQA